MHDARAAAPQSGFRFFLEVGRSVGRRMYGVWQQSLGVRYVRALHRLQRPLSRSLCCVSERAEILVLPLSSHPSLPLPHNWKPKPFVCVAGKQKFLWESLHLQQSQTEKRGPILLSSGTWILWCVHRDLRGNEKRRARAGAIYGMGHDLVSHREKRERQRQDVGWDNLKTPVSAFYESL